MMKITFIIYVKKKIFLSHNTKAHSLQNITFMHTIISV